MKTIIVSCVLSFFAATIAVAGSPYGLRWDETKPISYTFLADIDEKKKVDMREAMQRIQNSSCITFEEDGDSDQKLVINGTRDCASSNLGKEPPSRSPNVIGLKGCSSVIVFAHELLHMLGFTHEEGRSDRDDYLTFAPSVDESEIEGTAPPDTDNLGVPFNYGSAMMGSAWDYSTDSEPTMLPKDLQYKNTMYQKYEIAFTDFLALNRYYKCEESCKSNPPPYKNEGFPNPRDCSKCICPPFFFGDRCELSTLVKVDSEAFFNYTILTSYEDCWGYSDTWKAIFRILQLSLRNIKATKSSSSQGPPGSHLLVTINEIVPAAKLFCGNSCQYQRLEIVDGADLRVAGKSFCCPSDASTTVLSSTNRVAIRASAPCYKSHMYATISVVY